MTPVDLEDDVLPPLEDEDDADLAALGLDIGNLERGPDA